MSVTDVPLRDLYTAWREARRGKKPSQNRAAFEARWTDELLELQDELVAGTWTPAAPTCFVAPRPKAREIHAPDFRDRIVHHLAVPPLEAIYEPKFIHDSYSNREGKGTHAAVRRLQSFVRQVESGQGRGWYLQLDIYNCFNSIDRRRLYALLREQMTRHGVALPLRRAVHALLKASPLAGGVHYACSPDELAAVPPHKRLANARPGCGIAIGNLSSQFFANVYLNELDQFVKHTLRARRYLRYVDDFVLVHESREQLEAWRVAIERFLHERLALRLKDEVKLRPIADGVDFLGYIVRPTHILVRRRVVSHAREKLDAWGRAHARRDALRATPEQFREIQSVWASYAGHFSHAASSGLQASLHRQFPWLRRALMRRHFDYRLEERRVVVKRGAA